MKLNIPQEKLPAFTTTIINSFSFLLSTITNCIFVSLAPKKRRPSTSTTTIALSRRRPPSCRPPPAPGPPSRTPAAPRPKPPHQPPPPTTNNIPTAPRAPPASSRSRSARWSAPPPTLRSPPPRHSPRSPAGAQRPCPQWPRDSWRRAAGRARASAGGRGSSARRWVRVRALEVTLFRGDCSLCYYYSRDRDT